MPGGQTSFKKNDILVVDDATENLRILLNALTREGYSVRCVKSGALALSSSQAMPPDLILLDILMPQMNGFEVCQQLKQNTSTCDVPVIFLSALEDGSDKARAFALGGDDYISKPFSIDEVLARVKHQLAVKRRQQHLRQLADQYRQTSDELQDAHAFLMEVLNSLADGIAAFQSIRDGQGEIIDFEQKVANTTFAKILRKISWEKKETGDTLLDATAHYTDCDLFDLCVQAVENSQPLKREILCREETAPYWIEAFATKLRDGVVTRLRDINDTKRQIATLESVKRELYILATTDGLTNVANRYCFDSYLEAEWHRLARDRQPLSLLMGDIDKFKRFNDLCGHTVGDLCLQKVAMALQSVVRRPADLIARYGGEEFAILLPNTHLSGAMQIADSIQTAIRGIRLANTRYAECRQICLSLGVTCTIPLSHRSPQEIIEAADRALYRAKAEGGDTVCVECLHEVT